MDGWMDGWTGEGYDRYDVVMIMMVNVKCEDNLVLWAVYTPE